MSNAFHYLGQKTGWKRLSEQSRTALLYPLLKILDDLGVQPWHLSTIGGASLLGFAWFARTDILFAGTFILIHLCFDAVDGALARYQSNASPAGAITDVAVDEGGFALIMIILVGLGYISPLFGSAYLALYLIMVALLLMLDMQKKPYLWAIPTKNLFYLLFYMEMLDITSIVEPALIVFVIYMTMLDVHLFQKLRWALS